MEPQRQKQFTEALDQLGRVRGWPLLERSLAGENADQVSAALNEYVLAVLSQRAAKQVFDRSSFNCTGPIEEVQAGWANMNLLRKDYEFSLRQEAKSYRKLMIAMLGQEVVDENHLANVESETESESEDE
jgi:hypothetical protein